MVVKKLDSLEIARMRKHWDGSGSSDDHDPVEALFMTLDDIARGDIKPKHIFICIATEGSTEDDIGFRYMAAGPFMLRETIGLLEEAKVYLWEDAKR